MGGRPVCRGTPRAYPVLRHIPSFSPAKPRSYGTFPQIPPGPNGKALNPVGDVGCDGSTVHPTVFDDPIIL